MTIGTALRISVHLQVATAALALLLVGSDTVVSGAVMLFFTPLAYAAGGVWPRQKEQRGRFWNGMALLMLIIFITELVLTSDLLPPVVRLVVFLSVYKLFNMTANRDYITLLLLSFLQMLAATSISYESIYAVPFVLYVITSCITLVLHTRKTGMEREQLSRNVITGFPSRVNLEAVRARKLWAALGLALAVLVLTAAIFPLFPRMRTNVTAPGGEQEQQSISGFSNQVSLGDIADIKTSSEVVMRLQLTSEVTSLPRRPKLKGITLTRFDGYNWQHTFEGGRTVNRDSRSRFTLNTTPGGSGLEQEVFLNPLNTRVIFFTGAPQMGIGPFGIVYVDSMNTMMMGRQHDSQIRYSVRSKILTYRNRLVYDQTEPTRLTLRRFYLQFPENEIFTRQEQRRVRELAEELTVDINDPFDKALAIERYLSTQFDYTLQLSQYRNDRNKMAAFLFERQTGHCEYFASGMTLLCRSIGLPARLINGFQLGQRNDMGDFFTVRAADAHSWVEVYIPDVGWVEFDPTPATGQQSQFATTTPGFFSSIIDSIDLFWAQYILTYDANDQQTVIAIIREGFSNLTGLFSGISEYLLDLIPGISEELQGLLRIILSTALLAGSLLVIYFAVLKPALQELRRGRGKQKSGVGFFRQTLTLLKKHGIELEAGKTARSLLKNERLNGARQILRRLIGAYEEARFSLDDERRQAAMERGSGHYHDLRRELGRINAEERH